MSGIIEPNRTAMRNHNSERRSILSEIEETTVPIVQMAKNNDDFRKVIKTGEKTQVVLMAVPEGEEIEAETHEGMIKS